jgi:hypothetical protein
VEPTLEPSGKPLVYEYFRAALIADLRLTATAGALKYALTLLRQSKYLLEAVTWKIAELRRLDRLNNEDFESIRTALADAIVDIRGIKKNRDSKKVRGTIRDPARWLLEREGLVIRCGRNLTSDRGMKCMQRMCSLVGTRNGPTITLVHAILFFD